MPGEARQGDLPMAYREKYFRLTKTMALFEKLTPEELEKVMELGLTRTAAKDTLLFKKGSFGREMYVILSGKVNIMDQCKVFATLEAGETFGEMSLVSELPRAADAVTIEPCSMFVLPSQAFDRLLSKRIAVKLLLNISKTLCERLREADEVLARIL
jgi:CRP-like cAMP-binding protein